MALTGKYQLVRDNGVVDYMKAHDIPDDRAKKLLEDAKSFEISVSGDNITITRPSRTHKLINNKEVTEKNPDGSEHKSTAILNGNTLTVNAAASTGKWTRVYTVSGSELTVTSVSTKPNVPDAVLVYKKL